MLHFLDWQRLDKFRQNFGIATGAVLFLDKISNVENSHTHDKLIYYTDKESIKDD